MNEEMPYHTSLFVSYPISPGFVVQDDKEKEQSGYAAIFLFLK